MEDCVRVGGDALQDGCVLGHVRCPQCGIALLEGPALSNGNGTHTCNFCSHVWDGDVCVGNPLAALHPYLSAEGAVVLKSARPWECVSSNQFAKVACVSMVYLAIVQQLGDLNFTVSFCYLTLCDHS